MHDSSICTFLAILQFNKKLIFFFTFSLSTKNLIFRGHLLHSVLTVYAFHPSSQPQLLLMAACTLGQTLRTESIGMESNNVYTKPWPMGHWREGTKNYLFKKSPKIIRFGKSSQCSARVYFKLIKFCMI